MPRFLPFIAAGLLAIFPADAGAQSRELSIQTFHAADGNGDRLLDRHEFRAFIGMLADAGVVWSNRIRSLGVIPLAFTRVDADGNGQATPEELLAAGRAHQQ